MILRQTPSLLAALIVAGALFTPPALAQATKGAAGKGAPAATGKASTPPPPASATAAAAAPPVTAAPEAKSPAATAKALYEQGVDLAGQRKLDEAEGKFLEAWALQKSYDVAANLGEVSMMLDKPAEAAFFLTFALANFPASGKEEKRLWIEKRLVEAKSKVAVVTIAVNVAGADVRINGKAAGKSPIEGELFVPPGECTIEVTAGPELEPFKQTIRTPAGTSHKVSADLAAPAKSPVPAFVAGGVGLAGLAAGIALFVVSNDKYEEARRLHDEIAGSTTGSRTCAAGQSPHPKCAELKSAAEQSDALHAPGIGLLVGGAVVTAAAGAYFGYTLTTASPKTARRPAVTRVGLRGAGLFLEGKF